MASLQDLELKLFPTFQVLLEAVNNVAKEAGFTVLIKHNNNYRDHQPRQYDLDCIKGIQSDYPWKAKAASAGYAVHTRLIVQPNSFYYYRYLGL